MSSPVEPPAPSVPAGELQPELTARALILGALLGIVFGAASTYLALRVGLTTSASVPIAVLAISALRRRNGKRAILEHNIVQTTGSAGESVAAAVVFTVPALIFLGYPLEVGITTLIALTGGVLGVLMMVPLRRYLIVKEHGVLRYPEGKACAEILQAGEQGGMSAGKVFAGLGIGAAFKAFQAVLGGIKGTLARPLEFYRGSEIACDFAPELLGVGYIIGYRTSLMMVAGSLLAGFVLAPLIVLFGSGLAQPLPPASDLISAMEPGDVWHNYIRHIGAGAVAVGGLFALARALPSIVASIRASAKSLAGGASSSAKVERTERDTPVSILAGGSLLLIGLVWFVPAFQMNLLGALLILVLGFLFSVVSSRITGEVGSSSSPLSGMTIAVLMATCGIFLAVGWEGPAYSRLALMVGAVVCIAISNAGTCSQDLKTGFLVGATPIRQQGALLVGVLTSVLAVGWTSYLLNSAQAKEERVATPFVVAAAALERAELVDGADGNTYRYVRLSSDDIAQSGVAGASAGTYLVDEATREARFARTEGIGSDAFPAPQARLMSVVIDGLMTHRLPWDLILIGGAIAVFMELMGVRSLTFAVGVYLPLAATLPVYLGGLVRLIADKVYRRTPDAEDETHGTLWSSGLIAGASIVGIASAALRFLPATDGDTGWHPSIAFLRELPTTQSDLFGIALLALLGWLMFRGARGPAKDTSGSETRPETPRS